MVAVDAFDPTFWDTVASDEGKNRVVFPASRERELHPPQALASLDNSAHSFDTTGRWRSFRTALVCEKTSLQPILTTEVYLTHELSLGWFNFSRLEVSGGVRRM